MIAAIVVLSIVTGVCFTAIACWGAATAWAAGREFERLGLPGDISQALHEELEARWRQARLASGGA